MDTTVRASYFYSMIWMLLLILFLLFLLWFLLVPVVIFIHTEAGRYSLRMPGVFSAKAVTGGDLFLIRGWILFVPYRFNPFAPRRKKSRKKKDPGNKKKRFRMPSGGLTLARDALRTVRIRKFEMDIDTGDFPMNAWLVPVFSLVEGYNRQLRVNFNGNTSLLLDLRLRLGALLWAVIRNRIKHRF
jgi:hypothetical protein